MTKSLECFTDEIIQYKKPPICICGDYKDNHIGGWGSRRDCSRCECQHYKRDLNKEGSYKLVTFLDPYDWIDIILGYSFHFKQITDSHKINESIKQKYENMEDLK